MKTVGRIILLVVGGLMIASAIRDLVGCVNGLKAHSLTWQTLLQSLKDPNLRQAYMQYLTGILKASGLIIVSASAIFAGIKGKGGFWFTIFSLVILGLFIYDIVGKSKAGVFTGSDKWRHILQLVIDSGTQIGYVSGFILLKLSRE